MKLLDLFKNKNMMETVLLEEKDNFTNITIRYVVKIDHSNNKVSLIEVSDKVKKLKIYDLDAFLNNRPSINDLIRKKIQDLGYKKEQNLESPYFFKMEEFYDIDNVKDSTYKKYLLLKEKLLEVSKENNIELSNDIIKDIIDMIDKDYREYSKSKGYEMSANIGFCKSIKDIEEETLKELNGKKDSTKFMYANRHLVSYYYSFLKNLPYLIDILDKKNLTEEEKITIKKYTELFTVLESYMNIIKKLESSANEIDNSIMNDNKIKMNSNEEFVNRLNELLSKVNTDKEYLFIHATTSLESAKNILDKGLYTYSDDLSSFSFPFENLDQIFTYSYGNLFNRFGDYIVLFRLPGNRHLDKLSEKERKEALSMIEMRRANVIMEPTNKVNSMDILGVVDKNKMEVLFNDNFKPLENNETLKK